MRILFTARPLVGHYLPMRPLMEALRKAGDEVAVATGEPLVAQVRQDGFTGFRMGLGRDDPVVQKQRAVMETLAPEQIRRYVFSDYFVRTEIPPRLAELHAAVDRFAPHVMVHEMAELAGPLVARAHAIPYATHSYGSYLPADTAAIAGAAAAPLWADAGLDPHPRAGLYGDVYFDVCPPSLQGPKPQGMGRVWPIGLPPPPAAENAPAWLASLGARALVYVTLGTVFNDKLEVFRTLVAGVRDHDVEVLVTVGADGDPAMLGPQPANVRVERFVDQRAVLPSCRLAVIHGGAGSTFGALSFGIPLLVAPQSADQFVNAERTLAAGAGLVLTPSELTVDAVHGAVARLLRERSFSEAATRVQTEFAAMPPPSAARAVLAELAALP